MDGQQFDDLARTLSHSRSRRVLIGLAASLSLVPFLAGGKKKKKKRRGKKKKPGCEACTECQRCEADTCVNLPNGTQCNSTDSCHAGVCGCGDQCCGLEYCPRSTHRCLANSTCIVLCRSDPDDPFLEACPSNCSCKTSTEGPVCSDDQETQFTCADIPSCDSSADCPKGRYCTELDGQVAAGCGYLKGCKRAC